MALFKQYVKKNGEKAWMFQSYLGIDESTGKKIKTTRRGFQTKKDAQLELNKLKIAFESNDTATRKELTYREIYDLWLPNYERTVKESTFAKTENYFDRIILPSFGNYKINKINAAVAQKFANEMADKYVVYRQLVSNTSRIFEYAIKLNYADDNPFKRITIPKRKTSLDDEKKLNFYTKDELEQFLKIAESEESYKSYTFFRLLAFSGMRKGEMLALTWNDIDFNNKIIKINKTQTMGKDRRLYIDHPKTKNSKREIPIDDKTLAILKKWRTEQKKIYLEFGIKTNKKNQLVFSNHLNEMLQPSQPRKWLNSIIKRHNLKPITVHGFRHTNATLLIESGASVKDVQVRLGHATVQVTMDLYLHITQERNKETMENLVKYINF
ncbi:site-specific integrase [Enterococcus sp. ALS3]|uniref:Site-specific integrase n=1 Tax=Enterococcus alishanensis TaxID=1303817 RepID=A0ABS6TDW5_9ENTE|nr:site-specific integrase [Enterococcus alishanensis]MBV7391093.1 site-specific integrase [Enterococcus alishanensis]